MRWLFVCALTLTVAATSPTEAQEAPPGDEADGAARAEFEAGTEAFEQGRYEDAIEYWERSYELSHQPALLFNIGHALDRLQREDEAIEAFTRYLNESEEVPNRAEVEARVRALRDAQADRATADDSGTGAGPFILIGVGGAAAIAGGVLFGIAVADKSTVENAPNGSRWADYESQEGRVTTFSVVGALLVGVGLAAAVAGLVWVLSGDDEETTEVVATPGGFILRGRF